MNRLDDSARTHTQSSTDDVHSVCSQLSGVRFQDLAPPRVFPKAHQSSILRKYEEPALLVANPVRYSTIRFENTHSVVDFAQFGELPTFRKQACRSTNNPWRRYGALIKLTNTGGFAPNIGSKKDRKKREQLVYVKQNMKLPSPPQCSQMSLNKAREPGFYERKLSLQIPKAVPVDLAAQVMARQLKAFILEHGVQLMTDDISKIE